MPHYKLAEALRKTKPLTSSNRKVSAVVALLRDEEDGVGLPRNRWAKASHWLPSTAVLSPSGETDSEERAETPDVGGVSCSRGLTPSREARPPRSPTASVRSRCREAANSYSKGQTNSN
jgi:hypothetical protein